ncbi:MAG: hypothetical protein K2N40_01730, partial [Ureaplasma sp.]|nr:hypothetical protein [Ureaplasma sp.]
NKFVCYALGTRKINSKNSFSLIFGNFLEFEFFYSNNPEKISKLKKVTTLNAINFENSFNLGILVANDILSIKKTNKNDYIFYQNILLKVYKNENELAIAVYAYIYYLYTQYPEWNFYKCGLHHSYSDSIDLFNSNLFKCSKCSVNQQTYNLDINEIKFILYLLKSSSLDELFINCFLNKYNINWKKIYDYLNYLFNQYIRILNKEKKKSK